MDLPTAIYERIKSFRVESKIAEVKSVRNYRNGEQHDKMSNSYQLTQIDGMALYSFTHYQPDCNIE